MSRNKSIGMRIIILLLSILLLFPAIYAEKSLPEKSGFMGNCNFTSDCKPGLRCDYKTGKCVYCTSWVHCKKGECVNGKCITIPLGGEGCISNRHCAQGYCVDGKCVECRSWVDCKRGTCINGKCVVKKNKEECKWGRECESGICAYVNGRKVCAQCTGKSYGCGKGEVCVDGECVKNQPKNLKKNGEPCKFYYECASGKCCNIGGRKICSSCCYDVQCRVFNGRGYCDLSSYSCKVKKEGEKCSSTFECMKGYVCDEKTHTCKKYIPPWDRSKEGESCKEKKCKVGLHCDPKTKICVRCYKDEHCSWGHCDLKAHKCVLNKIGEKCDSFLDCERHAPCKEGVCSACYSDLDCRSRRGVCTKTDKGYWDCVPKGENANCRFNWECAQGLTCKAGKCTKISKPSDNSRKKKKGKYWDKCENNEDCDSSLGLKCCLVQNQKRCVHCCNSNDCKIGICTSKGECVLQEEGKPCEHNKDCETALCYKVRTKKVCVQCIPELEDKFCDLEKNEKCIDYSCIRACIDPDANMREFQIYKRSTTQDYTKKRLTDYCEGNNLHEGTCIHGEIYESVIICPYGCKNGACIKKEDSKPKTNCVDTDGGPNIYKYGVTKDSLGNIWKDKCAFGNFVIEGYCENGVAKYVTLPCPEGEYICKNGECTPFHPEPGAQTKNKQKKEENKKKIKKEEVKKFVKTAKNIVRKTLPDIDEKTLDKIESIVNSFLDKYLK